MNGLGDPGFSFGYFSVGSGEAGRGLSLSLSLSLSRGRGRRLRARRGGQLRAQGEREERGERSVQAHSVPP